MSFDPFDTDDSSPRQRPSTATGPPDPRDFQWISDGKKKTATKRYEQGHVVQTSPITWTVLQWASKGDHFPEYFIEKVERNGKAKHTCSCTTHMGGEYRRGLCTHALAAMIYTFEEGDTWHGSETTETPTTQPSTLSVGSNPSSTGEEAPSEGSPSTRTTASNADRSTASSPEANGTTQPRKKRRRRKQTSAPGTTGGTEKGSIASPTTPTSSTTPPSIRHANSVPVANVPGIWPSWVKVFRPLQIEGRDNIVEAFENVDLVYCDGPTGTGKSLIAAMAAQGMQKRALIVSADKALQDQYLRDFEEIGARTIKGRANYRPQIPVAWDDSLMKEVDVTCDDCDWTTSQGCSFCPDPDTCSYRAAKAAAVASPLAILNYAYFLREAASARAMFSNQDLIVCDECDVLENILLSQAEVSFSQRLRRDLHLGQPTKLDDETGDTWLEWLVETVAPALEADVDKVRATGHGIERRRRLKFLMSKIDETELLIETMENDGDANWVLSGYKKDRNKRDKDGPMVFKPVRVGDYGQRLLWRHGTKFLLMSATIVSADELSETLGYSRPFEVVNIPMPFAVERREIHYIPVAKVTRKTKVEALPKIVAGVKALLNQWPNERAIIHTVSYELTQMVRDSIMRETERSVFTYKDSSEKDKIISDFESTPSGVLIGPSISRGTDFKGDKARINIICKVPYLSLGEQQVKARLYGKGGQLWYATKAIREIVQACGRTTRSEDDWSVTYILDAALGQLLKDNRRLFPRWWDEALRTTIKPTQLLEGRPIPKPQFTSDEGTSNG